MLDTQQKRMSAAYAGTTALPPSVFPSGAIDAAERLNIGWSYAGNTLAAPTLVPVEDRLSIGTIFGASIPETRIGGI